MNKKIIIAIIIVVLLLLGIIGYMMMGKKSLPSTTTVNPTASVTNAVVQDVVPDFKKALEGSGSMKCTLTKGETTGTTYIKNGKVRFEGTIQGANNNTIMVDKIVYSWVTGAKTGFMIDTSAVASITPPAGATNNYQGVYKMKTEFDTYKPQCTNQEVADSLFEKPADVTFTDMGKTLKDMKSQIPANVTIPAGVKIPQY